MTIAVMMDYLVCHEVEYSGRKEPRSFAGIDVFAVLTRTAGITESMTLLPTNLIIIELLYN